MKRNKSPGKSNGVTPLETLPGKCVGGLTMRLLPVPREPYRVSLLHEKIVPFSATPVIYHKATAELVFVVKGRATAKLNGRRVRVKAGDVFEIQAGTAHQFITGEAGVEAISLFSPPLDPENHDAHLGKDAKPAVRPAKKRFMR